MLGKASNHSPPNHKQQPQNMAQQQQQQHQQQFRQPGPSSLTADEFERMLINDVQTRMGDVPMNSGRVQGGYIPYQPYRQQPNDFDASGNPALHDMANRGPSGSQMRDDEFLSDFDDGPKRRVRGDESQNLAAILEPDSTPQKENVFLPSKKESRKKLFKFGGKKNKKPEAIVSSSSSSKVASPVQNQQQSLYSADFQNSSSIHQQLNMRQQQFSAVDNVVRQQNSQVDYTQSFRQHVHNQPQSQAPQINNRGAPAGMGGDAFRAGHQHLFDQRPNGPGSNNFHPVYGQPGNSYDPALQYSSASHHGGSSPAPQAYEGAPAQPRQYEDISGDVSLMKPGQTGRKGRFEVTRHDDYVPEHSPSPTGMRGRQAAAAAFEDVYNMGSMMDASNSPMSPNSSFIATPQLNPMEYPTGTPNQYFEGGSPLQPRGAPSSPRSLPSTVVASFPPRNVMVSGGSTAGNVEYAPNNQPQEDLYSDEEDDGLWPLEHIEDQGMDEQIERNTEFNAIIENFNSVKEDASKPLTSGGGGGPRKSVVFALEEQEQEQPDEKPVHRAGRVPATGNEGPNFQARQSSLSSSVPEQKQQQQPVPVQEKTQHQQPVPVQEKTQHQRTAPLQEKTQHQRTASQPHKKRKKKIRHVQIQTRGPSRKDFSCQTTNAGDFAADDKADPLEAEKTIILLEDLARENESLQAEVRELSEAQTEADEREANLQLENVQVREEMEDNRVKFDKLSAQAYKKIKDLLMERKMLDVEVSTLRDQLLALQDAQSKEWMDDQE
ncbi:MAG: hypothetical protein SGCHY_002936 [Lobulomycetales sp.]